MIRGFFLVSIKAFCSQLKKICPLVEVGNLFTNVLKWKAQHDCVLKNSSFRARACKQPLVAIGKQAKKPASRKPPYAPTRFLGRKLQFINNLKFFASFPTMNLILMLYTCSQVEINQFIQLFLINLFHLIWWGFLLGY